MTPMETEGENYRNMTDLLAVRKGAKGESV